MSVHATQQLPNADTWCQLLPSMRIVQPAAACSSVLRFAFRTTCYGIDGAVFSFLVCKPNVSARRLGRWARGSP